MSLREVPSTWAHANFEDVFEVKSDRGRRLPESSYLESGTFPVVDQGEEPIGGFCNDPDLLFDEDLPVILFGDHTRRAKLLENPFVVGAQGIKILRPRDELNPRFLLYQFHTLDIPDKGYSRHFQYLRKAPFVLAPVNEQNRIVAEIEKQFTRLDAATAALKRVQANLKRYRASVLKAACEGHLVPTEADLAHKEGRDYEPADKLLQRILRERRARWEADILAKMIACGKPPQDDRWKQRYNDPSAPGTTNLPDLPEGWCWASLDQLGFIQGGITKGQKRRPDEKIRPVPYLRVANVQRGYLDLAELKQIDATEAEVEELALVRDDVLFNEGGDRDKLGRGWIWEEQVPLCIHQNHVFRARLVFPGIQSRFVSYYANAFGQKYFFDEGKHTTNLASISMTKLRALPIPLPPADEQRRIVQAIEFEENGIGRQETATARGLKRQEALRRSLLASAFSGRLVPQDPADEPASLLLDRLRAERIRAGTTKPPRRSRKEPVHA